MLKSLCQEIRNLPITTITIVIDKSKIKRSHSNFRNLPKERSWEFLIERYNLFLKNAPDKKGIIISDAITNHIENEHRIFAKSILESSFHVDHFHFIESILFEPSHSSNMLQISDIISYSYGRKFNIGDSMYYDILSPLSFEQDGNPLGRGQKFWPV